MFFFTLLYVMYIKHMVHMRSIIDIQPMFRCWFKSETQMCDMSQEFGSRDTVPKQHAEKRSPWDDVYYTYFFLIGDWKYMFTLVCIDSSIHSFIHPYLQLHVFHVSLVSIVVLSTSFRVKRLLPSIRTMAAVEVPELTEKMKELSTEVSGGSLSWT